jgi:hypothetical protein
MQNDLHREDLMKSDVLSEIVLLGSGIVLFVPLLLLLFAILVHSPSLP